ncbi:MAG: hypothetical protein MJ175_06155 [Clostridia bacterium]|nr:hypothetical protein [Clostridia bacterium]
MKFSREQKENLDIRDICAFCENASCLRNEDEMLCRFNGVVSADGTCRKFRYDLLKRKPAKKNAALPKVELPDLDD